MFFHTINLYNSTDPTEPLAKDSQTDFHIDVVDKEPPKDQGDREDKTTEATANDRFSVVGSNGKVCWYF